MSLLALPARHTLNPLLRARPAIAGAQDSTGPGRTGSSGSAEGAPLAVYAATTLSGAARA
jgi:hypothetical protein